MPPTSALRPRLSRFPRSPIQRPRRTFLSSILSAAAAPPPSQTVTASRRLPHHHADLYGLIADIDSYSAFLPYCSASRVTSWTACADPEFGRRWPTRADLTAGWGGLEQTYTSRVFCVPGSIVEALSGEGARSGIAPDVLARYGLEDEPFSMPTPTRRDNVGGEEGVFRTLVTRWTVTPVEPGALTERGDEGAMRAGGRMGWSDVNLNIRFQFANPLYGAVSSAVADKVAPLMIEAFVERAKKVLR
ncbi:putative cyclase dehydrase family protein [Rosellinia necatrix]|uniref:Putative cyclase dehydrase family protein n=1 Tax=Rosellinia necatrix TaxID=77044 RepID=A0A1W2TLI3_ROSNE|nr:putative cyclase dehydrase family protein [Rosellinia necatrix]